MTLLAAVALAFLLTFALLHWLLRGRLASAAMDKPNHRSLHTVPTPRIGGIGVLAGILAGGALAGGVPPLLFGLLLVLASFSFLDDRWNLPAAVRLPVHLAVAAVWIVGAGLNPPSDGTANGAAGGVTDGLTALALVFLLGWMTNLYNFMDGANGLAGGMTVFGFGAYGAAAWLGGQPAFAALAWVVAAAALAFLFFNFDPARVFLGDAGSIPLGFLAGALGLAGWRAALWPAWFPLLVFSPFIVDASRTLLLRLLRGERVWQAHREHAYQRLVRCGWTHRRLALTAYLLMAACALTALVLRDAGTTPVTIGLALWAIIYTGLLAAVDRRWRRCGGGTA